MKTALIQLELHDDIVSARDKMTWSESPCILLVWPKRGHILRRLVDLVLIKRQGDQLGARVGLVTRDRVVISYAWEVGLPVFADTETALQIDWQAAPSSSPALASREKSVDLVELHREKDRLHRISPSIFEQIGWRLLFFTLAILSVLALALFFYPSAQLVISPAVQVQSMNLEVRAGPTVRSPGLSGGIPAQVLTVVVEGQQEVQSTGTTQVADGFASGLVMLSNLTLSAVEIPEGTVVRTLDDPPVRFQTTEHATVPAGPGKTAVVVVRAVLPGPTENLEAKKIQSLEGDASRQVVVTNLEALSGGTEQLSAAPSQSDYQKAREALLASLEQLARQDLEGLLAPGQQFIPASLQLKAVQQEISVPPVGQPGEHLQLNIRVEYAAWQVLDGDLQTVALASLDAALPGGFIPLPGSLTLNPITQPEKTGSNIVRWHVNAKRILQAYRSSDQIIGTVQGRSVAQAIGSLKALLPMQSEPRVLLTPSWWFWMPSLPFRIQVMTQ